MNSRYSNLLYGRKIDISKGKKVTRSFVHVRYIFKSLSYAFGGYVWRDYIDYKGILNFFIKGQFILPLSIFAIVYGMTQLFAFAIFSIILHLKSVKMKKMILAYQLSNNEFIAGLDSIKHLTKSLTHVDLNQNLILETFEKIKKEVSPKEFQDIENGLEAERINLKANFTVAFRALIALCIFKSTLPEFHWALFSFTIIFLFLWAGLMIISYQFLNVLPTLFKKFNSKAE